MAAKKRIRKTKRPISNGEPDYAAMIEQAEQATRLVTLDGELRSIVVQMVLDDLLRRANDPSQNVLSPTKTFTPSQWTCSGHRA